DGEGARAPFGGCALPVSESARARRRRRAVDHRLGLLVLVRRPTEV
ncbi:MAG: hypothetical protein AVDCRST_MAG59-611, partial [uncultured Thermomicrobiales bacterium]